MLTSINAQVPSLMQMFLQNNFFSTKDISSDSSKVSPINGEYSKSAESEEASQKVGAEQSHFTFLMQNALQRFGNNQSLNLSTSNKYQKDTDKVDQTNQSNPYEELERKAQYAGLLLV